MSDRQNYTPTGALVRESMPEDFTDVLGAMFLCGWNYSFDNYLIEEFVNRVELRAHRVDREGGYAADANNKEVQLVWEYRGGEWAVVKPETGLVKTSAKEGEKPLIPRNTDQIVDYIAKRTNDWDLVPVKDDSADVDEAEVPENALPVGDSHKEGIVDEEVIEE